MQIQSYKVTKRKVRKVIAQQSHKLRDNIGTDVYSNGTFAGLGYLEVSVDSPCKWWRMAQFLCWLDPNHKHIIADPRPQKNQLVLYCMSNA